MSTGPGKFGKILRTDYRNFEFNAYLSIHEIQMFGRTQTTLLNRVRNYLETRDIPMIMEQHDNTWMLQFERLDDARMFVLSLSDVIETNGVNFD